MPTAGGFTNLIQGQGRFRRVVRIQSAGPNARGRVRRDGWKRIRTISRVGTAKSRALGPLGGDDHPLFSSRVLSQFGHGMPLFFDKNSLSVGLNIGKTQLYVKQKRPQDTGCFLNTSVGQSDKSFRRGTMAVKCRNYDFINR